MPGSPKRNSQRNPIPSRFISNLPATPTPASKRQRHLVEIRRIMDYSSPEYSSEFDDSYASDTSIESMFDSAAAKPSWKECSIAAGVDPLNKNTDKQQSVSFKQGHEIQQIKTFNSDIQSKQPCGLKSVQSMTSLENFGSEIHQQHESLKSTVAEVMQLRQQTRANTSGLRAVASAPSLQTLVPNDQTQIQGRFVNTNPDKHLQEILRQHGVNFQTFPALSLGEQFFLQTTEDHIRAYTTEIITAVRTRDIDGLRYMHHSGRILQCSNRFGETIVHMACRKGFLDVVTFLSEEAKVSIRLRDDYGRTPLHDAFWTREPEIEVVKLLVSKCPDMLLITDKRGFTPLSYVRREHWGIWCQFLEENQNLLLPKELLGSQ